MNRSPGPLLTLEPLLDAVREGVESEGWRLSGLQKTTSLQFEGRWSGQSTRSAYLFFHRPGVPNEVSIDVFLDETTRGLQGNLALVVDGPTLGEMGSSRAALVRLSAAATATLPEGYRTPLTLRLQLPSGARAPEDADTECRFKLHIPQRALTAGPSAVSALCATVVRAFEELLGHPEVQGFME